MRLLASVIAIDYPNSKLVMPKTLCKGTFGISLVYIRAVSNTFCRLNCSTIFKASVLGSGISK